VLIAPLRKKKWVCQVQLTNGMEGFIPVWKNLRYKVTHNVYFESKEILEEHIMSYLKVRSSNRIYSNVL
jgi:hypothetical protein